MDWDAVGTLAEFVAANGVIITLVYFAVQVRHSRELLERNDKLALGQVFQTRIDGRRGFEKIVRSEAAPETLIEPAGATSSNQQSV